MNKRLPDSDLPSVSIVINTLNRANLLDDAIRGVFQLDYPQLELVVVNGPSTDNSEQVLEGWAGAIKHLRCDAANLSISRNVAIAAADGEIVAFMDDDAAPHPDWLRHLARHYADPAIGGVGGYTVDNTGVRWQVRKTICDRFGNAYSVSDLLNERSLNVPGTPFYPSLLGTNSSFRRSALEEIGGFDHTFAYFLDETDVCLRLVDHGWSIVYEPAAMIFHQFAESHTRTVTRKPRSLYPSVVSKTYFINRHGQAEGYGGSSKAIQDYRDELFRANSWLAEHGEISWDHCAKLDRDVERGTADGLKASYRAHGNQQPSGGLSSLEVARTPLLPLPREAGKLRVALVSQGLPPANDMGIARWTSLLAEGLRDLGFHVHLISRATGPAARSFRNGIWHHEVERRKDGSAAIAIRYGLPADVCEWLSGTMREIAFLKTFGLDLVSFPIWDLEALPVLDDPELASVISLHTTYRLARPFKPEWNAKIVYGRAFVDRMIAAETSALSRAPAILANTSAVVAEIDEAYGLSIRDRCGVVAHGTPDLLASAGMSLDEKLARQKSRGLLRILFAGRFEPRKGYDLALRLASALDGVHGLRFDFAGCTLDAATIARAIEVCGVDPRKLQNAEFHGEVPRSDLDRLFLESDVVFMPSRFESFGLVAIEAMSAGSPVLGLASGGLQEVVRDGLSGHLWDEEAGIVEGCAKLVTRLASDPEELARLSRGAYAEFVERFSVSVMASGVAEFYRSTVEARRERL